MKKENRITPENITALKPFEIFVFGSNEAGRHGAGAAKTAIGWGAEYGNPFGLQGNTYAIPTKDVTIKTLGLHPIAKYVHRFVWEARQLSTWTFLVTPIGCGLANYSPQDIAPLFKEAVNVPNIHLPQSFWDVLNNM